MRTTDSPERRRELEDEAERLRAAERERRYQREAEESALEDDTPPVPPSWMSTRGELGSTHTLFEQEQEEEDDE